MIISLDSFDHGDLSAVHLAALRDRSVLSLGFASGGRRRSELTSLDCADIERRIWTGQDGAGGSAPAVFLHLGRTKTTDAQDDLQVAVIGRAVADLDAWLVAAEISAGPIFRPVDRWGSVGQAPLSPQTVNRIVKKRLGDAGFDAASYSAHGLRSGYLTEAFLQGLSLPEAMSQSGHKSVNQAASYFKAFDRLSGRAARLLD
ncbi:tyrosine-type recombinase/integrase [Loktanella sp. DJP18]|uniref:tyrosine-type recombinase/integrase n=1 Tax=Loktanella sp. DJP18 TaxID=3409788 RepID=UPI003BB67BDD